MFDEIVTRIVVIGFISAFLGIIVTRKNGPGFFFFKNGIFTFIKNQVQPIVNLTLAICIGVVYYLLLSIYITPYVTEETLVISIAYPLVSIVFSSMTFIVAKRIGVTYSIGGFVKKVLSCSACLAMWSTLAISLILFGFTSQQFLLVPAATMFAYFLMSMCGVNDLLTP